MKVVSRAIIAGAVFGSAAYAANTEAQNPPTVLEQSRPADLTVKIATIAAGRLVIVGQTIRPAMDVAIAGTTLRARSDGQGLFRFDVTYRTPDCSVKLATRTASVAVLVSDCGPQGLISRGVWASAGQYAARDLVVDGGSAWLAIKINQSERLTGL